MASFDLSLTLRTTDAVPALIRARTTDFEELDARVLNDGFVTSAGNTGEELREYLVGGHSRAVYASRLGDYPAVEIGLGEWDGAVAEVLEDGSVVVRYTENGEYRRGDSSGHALEAMPIAPGSVLNIRRPCRAVSSPMVEIRRIRRSGSDSSPEKAEPSLR